MLYELISTKTMEEIDRGLRESAARHQFGVITVHDLKQTMADKGVQLDTECQIYEVCNPHQAKRVLEANGAVSTALPCRISVYGLPGAYRLATILPSALIGMFHSPELEPVANEVEAVVKQMIQDAAG